MKSVFLMKYYLLSSGTAVLEDTQSNRIFVLLPPQDFVPGYTDDFDPGRFVQISEPEQEVLQQLERQEVQQARLGLHFFAQSQNSWIVGHENNPALFVEIPFEWPREASTNALLTDAQIESLATLAELHTTIDNPFEVMDGGAGLLVY